MRRTEKAIEEIVLNTLASLERPDLFRRPLVAFSDALDPRYAALKDLIGPWHKEPQQHLPGAKSVISCFVPFTREVAAAPRAAKDGSPLWSEAYIVINRHFDVITQAVCDYLSGLGHAALAMKATHTYDPADLKSAWSHRSAAVIAGLGAFGANRLLITEKGSGGRLCTVITSAVLKNDRPAAENKCLYVKNGSCGLCFDVCPPRALGPDRFEKFSCQGELLKNGRLLAQDFPQQTADTCGKCIGVCPVAYLE